MVFYRDTLGFIVKILHLIVSNDISGGRCAVAAGRALAALPLNLLTLVI